MTPITPQTPKTTEKPEASAAAELISKAETAIWGAPQLTADEIKKLTPAELDKAHKAGQLKAVTDGDEKRLLEIRQDPNAAEAAVAEAGDDTAADDGEEVEDSSEDPELSQWHTAAAEKYGAEQLTAAEADELRKTDPAELKRLAAAGALKALAAGDTGPTPTSK